MHKLNLVMCVRMSMFLSHITSVFGTDNMQEVFKKYFNHPLVLCQEILQPSTIDSRPFPLSQSRGFFLKPSVSPFAFFFLSVSHPFYLVP